MTHSEDELDAFGEWERSTWEQRAAPYAASFGALTRGSIPALLDAARVRAGTTVLDVGTGPGFVALAAAARGARVRAVDRSAAMVEIARAAGVDASEAGVESMPFPELSFDAVVAGYLLNHLARPDAAVAEFARVLRPGGQLAMTVWDSPERNPALGLFGPVVTELGLTGVAPPGPDSQRFADDAALLELLAGWDEVTISRPRWTVRVEPGAWFDAVAGSAPRTGAVLAQAGPALRARARRRYVEEAVREFGVGDGLVELPAGAVLVSATKLELDQLLHDDLAALEAYAARRPDIYAGSRIVDGRGLVSLVDAPAHEAEVRALLARPGLIDIRSVPRSAVELARIRADVTQRTAGLFDALWVDELAVHVELPPVAEAVAAELQDEYGHTVRMTVGELEYPFRRDAPAPPRPPVPTNTIELPGVVADVAPDREVTPTGEDVTGWVRLTNHAAEPIEFMTATLCHGALLDEHGTLVAHHRRSVPAAGVVVRIPPGAEHALAFTCSTGSFDPATGPLLTPGTYRLVVAVEVDLAPDRRGTWLTPTVPVELGPPCTPP